jgi:hypothetical protein
MILLTIEMCTFYGFAEPHHVGAAPAFALSLCYTPCMQR